MTKGKKQSPSVNYILTYTKNSHQIKSIENKYCFILTSDPLLKEVFKCPLMFTNKMSYNLANMLVTDETCYEITKKAYIQGCFPCRNCASCSSVLQCINYMSFHKKSVSE